MEVVLGVMVQKEGLARNIYLIIELKAAPPPFLDLSELPDIAAC